MARAGTGGNQLPLIAYTVEKNESCIDRPEPDGREVHDEQRRDLPDRDRAIRHRGGHVPMVILIDNDRRHSNYRIIEENVAPTVVAKYGTGGVIPR